jgi:hypothetical protein
MGCQEVLKMKTILLGLFVAALGVAQAAHTVTLAWTDALNPTGTTYSVYKATGLCSGTPTFAKIATAVSSMTYTDSSVAPGNYCYEVTATSGGVESAPSNTAGAPVPSFAPSQLAVTVK